MIVGLAALLALSAPTTVELVPTDDVWVYPHASDPGKDPFLRVWGTEDRSVPSTADDLDAYSFGYLRFDLTSLPSTGKLTSASLILTHTADPGYTESLVKANPLEVRLLTASFDEKNWSFEETSKVMPLSEKKGMLGTAYPDKIQTDGKTFKVPVDLLGGPGDLREAMVARKELLLGLASTLSPEVAGRNAVYKLYSRDAEKESDRPKLVLVFE